jgi:surfactin synthase thioesterase subunit
MSKVKLFCLPFAGGSRYSYNGYVKSAPSNLLVVPVELPGRGLRFNEELLVSAHTMVDDLFQQISGDLNQPYAIYGHSMGTLLGYLLTKRILKEKLRKPQHLFFSGRGGPSVKYDEPPRYALPKSEFVKKLRELGGSPDEVLEDDGLIDFFEPILRADFKAVETFEYEASEPFDIPITVMIGTNEKTNYEQAMAWKKETVSEVTVRQFPGKHFFIFQFEKEVIKIISKNL